MSEKRLGEFLVGKGVLTKEELQTALKAQQSSGKKLEETLVDKGYLDECQLTNLLGEYFGLEVFPGSEVELTPELPTLVSSQIAFRYNLSPVALKNGDLFVACTTPVNGSVLENLRRLTGKRVHLVMMKPSELDEVIHLVYSGKRGELALDAREALAPESPDYAIKLLDYLITRAIFMRASDLHIEPDRDLLRIRLRIDGVLRTVEQLPLAAAPLLISRIKVLSDMNIAERRSPQDGGFLFQQNGSPPTSVRVSTLPCSRGEKAVLRILPTYEKSFCINELGMERDTKRAFMEMLAAPNGLILVTGPSGSGKTYTLYAALKHLRSDSVNITTVEDPAEVQMDGINQTQVDHTAAKKYAYCIALKAILRQDPDIIMVGEIRDGDTARLTLQAALTGHLVLSTLHTNDAPSAVERLLDMGCERYLVASALRGVLAQRLIRIVCPECREEFSPQPSELEALEINPKENQAFYHGKGCGMCHDSGYRGRTGIFELLQVDQELQQLIAGGADAAKLKKHACSKAGMRTLREDGVVKVLKGTTTPFEVLRVTKEW